MTTQDILNLFETYSNIQASYENSRFVLTFQIDIFREFYALIIEYSINNDLHLKVESELWFSLDVTDILVFYEIDIDSIVNLTT